VLFEKRHTYDYEKYAILTYAAAAEAGSRKALYTLVNMAVDNTEYFIGD
jgi:hypothetical protein